MDTESKQNENIGTNGSSLKETIFQLVQRLLYDIWKSPINLVLAIIILYLLVKLVIVKRRPTSFNQQKKTPIQLPKMSKCDLTIQELRGYNGIESNGRILTAIHGDIFDVSRRIDLYGIGKQTVLSLVIG